MIAPAANVHSICWKSDNELITAIETTGNHITMDNKTGKI